jgi:hypothetical protein
MRLFAFFLICYVASLAGAQGQTTTVIPANEAAAHVNEWATVEGVVARRRLPSGPIPLLGHSLDFRVRFAMYAL